MLISPFLKRLLISRINKDTILEFNKLFYMKHGVYPVTYDSMDVEEIVKECVKSKRRFKTLLSYGFIWNNTPEGQAFWNEISSFVYDPSSKLDMKLLKLIANFDEHEYLQLGLSGFDFRAVTDLIENVEVTE